jgi:peroxiredoxin
VIAVSLLGEDRGTVEKAIQKTKPSLRFLFDPKREVTEKYTGKYEGGSCPARNLFVIGRDGRISYLCHYPGPEDTELLSQLDKATEK